MLLDFGGDKRVDGCDSRETGFVFGARGSIEAEDVEPRMSKWVNGRGGFGDAPRRDYDAITPCYWPHRAINVSLVIVQLMGCGYGGHSRIGNDPFDIVQGQDQLAPLLLLATCKDASERLLI